MTGARLPVVHVVHSLEAKTGGPARSVPALARATAALGRPVHLLCCDAAPPPGLGLPCTATGGAGFLGARVREALAALQSRQHHVLVHVHGVWRASGHAACVHARQHGLPLVVAPRGMLEPWALRHHGVRKRAAWRLYQRRDLRRADALHATSELEATALRSLLPGLRVAVVPNVVDLDDLPRRSGPPAGDPGLRAVSIGRLHHKKGLDLLAKAWARVRPAGWRMEVFGSAEGRAAQDLAACVEGLDLSAAWSIAGPVDVAARARVLAGADLFVLPSRSENFGLVVAEALAVGVPVLTTDATPWQRLADDGCGWCVPATVEGIAGALAAATALDRAALSAMGQRGADVVRTAFSASVIGPALEAFYATLEGGSVGPLRGPRG
jgi:glycosyltransferase involved in cell wall biosynthesis